jgi:SAM-dependent methyltransferase
VLRYFLREAENAELYGCDIDAASIEWLQQELSPPIRPFVNNEHPPLPFGDSELDLVWAFSVFTHLVDTWSNWLIELRRVLRPGGLLIASFLGRGVCEELAGEAWADEHFGMNVLGYGQSWDEGGPNVFVSPWWIRAHWGRAFDIAQLRDSERGHGFVLLKKPHSRTSPSPRQLELPEEAEPREWQALRHQVRQLQREIVELRAALLSSHGASESRMAPNQTHHPGSLFDRARRLRAVFGRRGAAGSDATT